MNVWICLVRREAFVGGESQRCRHTEKCSACVGTGVLGIHSNIDPATGEHLGDQDIPCPTCKGTGNFGGCGEMELIGGEPVEWCRIHGAERAITKCFRAVGRNLDPCQFESQVRVRP